MKGIQVSAEKLSQLKALRVYKNYNKSQISNSLMVWNACKFDTIVDNAHQLYETSRRLLGKNTILALPATTIQVLP